MSLKKFLPALSFLLFSAAAGAEQLTHAYQVREPATEDSVKEQMLARALDSLLIRLTADPQAPQNPALAGLRQAPQQLASQFGFEADGSAMLVEFDPVSTERALRQAGVALWGANRPLLLVWWLQEEVAGTRLLSDAQIASVELRNAAQHRGLPIQLPLGDLSEQLIEPQELLAEKSSALQAVSERYASDVQLVVISAQDGEQWGASWSLRWLDKQESGKVQAATPAALADAVMLEALQRLGAQFMATPGQESELELWIEGANVARFADLDRLLSSLDARLLRIEGPRLVYRVKASPEQIRAQMGLLRLQEIDLPPPELVAEAPELEATVVGEALAPIATIAPPPAADAPTQLRFRW